jgi:hypothetical protein
MKPFTFLSYFTATQKTRNTTEAKASWPSRRNGNVQALARSRNAYGSAGEAAYSCERHMGQPAQM